MTRERFQILAEAYGGDIARWPLVEHEAARRVLAEDADWAGAVLAVAARFDSLLARSPAPTPAADLFGRVIASAAATRARRGFRWLLPAGLGAGLAAACVAGLVMGVELSRTAIEDQAAGVDVAQDVLGLDPDEAA